MTLTTVNPALLDTQAQYTGFKNRIINGACVINQRASGVLTVNTSDTQFYPVDRMLTYGTTSAGVYTSQQSSVAPLGFNNAILCTVTSASTPSGGQEYGVRQNIEGFNIADFGWGAAGAQSVTVSFWVRSSIAGTYAGCATNGDYNRSYVFTYSINTANTYEYKTVTISGNTTGTWLTDNRAGLRLIFNLGAGSSKTGTAGVWGAGYLQSATSSVNWISNAGATFYITGVQLEKGSTATGFDYRPYGTELGLCQRYAYQMNANDSNGANRFAFGFAQAATKAFCQVPHPVPMRAKPSLTTTASTLALSDAIAGSTLTSISIQAVTSDVNKTCFDCTVASGLTAFRPMYLEANSTATILLLSSEL